MILELLLEAAVWTQHLLLITSHHPAKKLNQIQIWPHLPSALEHGITKVLPQGMKSQVHK